MATMLTNDERKIIADMVYPIWEANRAMDRSAALSMLTSNLEHEERADKKMLYDNGTLTPDELAKGKEIWAKVDKTYREFEHTKILEIVNGLEW